MRLSTFRKHNSNQNIIRLYYEMVDPDDRWTSSDMIDMGKKSEKYFVVK